MNLMVSTEGQEFIARDCVLFVGGDGTSEISAVGRGLDGLYYELWPNTSVLRKNEPGRELWHWTFSYKKRSDAIAAMKSRGQYGPFKKVAS